LRYEVFIIDGKRHGRAKEYFPNGKIKAISNWKYGKLDGEEVIFLANGSRRQVNEYKDGALSISWDYAKEGHVIEKRLYDSLGHIVDFFSYKSDGTRDFSFGKKDPIFIPPTDTFVLGMTYPTLIRLGNRQYDNIEVIIGDITDPDIARKNQPLSKKDSLTSILDITADSLGLRKISGIVIERSSTSDSVDVVPFTHRFYVIPPAPVPR